MCGVGDDEATASSVSVSGIVSSECEPFRRSGWTQLGFGDSLPPMTIILILAVALVAGVIIQNRWALLLPLGIGACVALAIAATGHGLGDTPIPFLVVVCTLVMVGGQGLRSQVISSIS